MTGIEASGKTILHSVGNFTILTKSYYSEVFFQPPTSQNPGEHIENIMGYTLAKLSGSLDICDEIIPQWPDFYPNSDE